MSTQEISQNPSYLRALADRLKSSWQEQSAKPINQSLADALKGTLRGVTADFLGAPADMATAYLAPPESGNPYANAIRGLFGGGATPVGGSDWWAGKINLPEGHGLAYEAGRMLAPNPLELARLAKSAGPMMRELITYHGTPHTFPPTERNPLGEFDASKIGTGEGAQMYGHGIYVAESPGVAKAYATGLGGRDADLISNGISRVIHFNGGDPARVRDALLTEGFPEGKLTPEIEAAVRHIVANTDAEGVPNSAAIKGYGVLKKLVPDTGTFYTVDLPDEHIASMLDWDKPLSALPEGVQNALSKDAYFSRLMGKGGLDSYFQNGAELYRSLTGRFVNDMPMHLPLEQAENMAQRNASEYLNSLGIPGIKYLDQASRGAGEGTRNFVLFNPDLATILRRE